MLQGHCCNSSRCTIGVNFLCSPIWLFPLFPFDLVSTCLLQIIGSRSLVAHQSQFQSYAHDAIRRFHAQGLTVTWARAFCPREIGHNRPIRYCEMVGQRLHGMIAAWYWCCCRCRCFHPQLRLYRNPSLTCHQQYFRSDWYYLPIVHSC